MSTFPEGFIPDRYQDVSGPVAIDHSFQEALSRIDSRLVLRWQPKWRLYAIFFKFPNGLLRSQPCHIIEDGNLGFRKPDARDLRVVQQASSIYAKEGLAAWTRMLAEREAAQEADRSASVRSAVQDRCAEMAREHDLTAKDFGKVRLPVPALA